MAGNGHRLEHEVITIRPIFAALALATLAACQPVTPEQQASRRSCIHQTGSRLCVEADSAEDLTRPDAGVANRGSLSGATGGP